MMRRADAVRHRQLDGEVEAGTLLPGRPDEGIGPYMMRRADAVRYRQLDGEGNSSPQAMWFGERLSLRASAHTGVAIRFPIHSE